MKIYTKTGDGGESSLYGGTRLLKSDVRLSAYGTIDELNASLGLVLAQTGADYYTVELRRVQAELFRVGAELATTAGQKLPVTVVGNKEIDVLEKHIDELELELPELKNFILPGGSQLAAQLHYTRTVARRAEREVVKLKASVNLRPELLMYLNRLSDYLFVLARHANSRVGDKEIIWSG
ncbi:MAG: cob(I)yrinic acid a,c-diamide adenosyltransferase [Patescibacteria group bacterium]